MTTDAFSLNFSFEDEKNASTPPNAVPDSPEDNAADNLLANNDLAPENAGDGESGENTTTSAYSFDLPDADAGTADATDPFAGFSFGFGNETNNDSFDDLPAEIGTVEAEAQEAESPSETEVDFAAELQNAGLEAELTPSTSEFDFPQDGDLRINPEPAALDDGQAFFLDSPDYFGNDEPVAEATEIEVAPISLEEPVAEIEAAPISLEEPVALAEAEANEDSEVEPIVLVTPVKLTGNVESDDPFAPFVKEPPHIATVAILGVSGIGANHAKWFAKHGCHVVAIMGTTAETNATNIKKLKDEFGFDGKAYTNIEQLLEETKPEIVCVATPSAFHFVHASMALEAGAHVLCEKPLTYAPARKLRENIAGATELIKTAKKKNLLLGTQLQYGAATPILTKLAGVAPEEVGDFAMEIETTNPSSPRDPHELWIDLGPHAVSIASFLGGEGATLLEDSIQFFPRVEGQMVEASARFSIRRADERFITVRAICRFAPKEAMWRAPHRRFSFNGRVVSYRGYKTSTGEFAAQFTAPDGYDSHYPDPVDFLIGNFVKSVAGEEELLIDGEFGKQNLEWLLKICA